jgi:3-deoxy-D-manno-octulosonic-acid transferase
MPWIVSAIYLCAIGCALPVLLYRRFTQGKYRDGWNEKLRGRLPIRESSRPCIWLHAVSVGEVLQLRAILQRLAAARPDCEFVITTTTQTGYGVAKEKFPEHTVCYFPLDFVWAVRAALDRVRPSLVVLVELELWPNFISEASRRGIPVALVNGRITEKSTRGYRWIRPVIARLLEKLAVIAVQNDLYGGRLLELGAPRDRVVVTGSVKFDGVETDRNNPRSVALLESFGIARGERVFIAGSTQEPEEEYALETWLSLRENLPDLRLILVPRHKERFDEVANLVTSRGLPLIRRSALRAGEARSTMADSPIAPVLLLDTLGELGACWGLADVAFVGGSLTNRGGQNMIEPAAYGAAILFGPNTHNFRDVTEALLDGGAATVVHDAGELTKSVRALLTDPARAKEQGSKARALILVQQGATARTVELLLEHLPAASAVAERAA